MGLKKVLVAPVRQAAMALLEPLERHLLANARPEHGPPCFIVGPPRSGTTLLYEAMVTRFRTAYFSNLAHRFYRTPAAATLLGRRAVASWQGRFESSYGHVQGWGAPNEGGWIWSRWIPEEEYLDETAAEDRDVESIRRTVFAVARVLHAPFVNKNVMHSVHMRLLDRIFPGCVFVEIRRKEEATIQSILRTRLDASQSSSAKEWISVKPSGWTEFSTRAPEEQVAAQVELTRKDIERDARLLGEDRRLAVDYEALCEDPAHTMQQVAAFWSRHGVELEHRRELPTRFRASSGSAAAASGSR